jgi:hypothetical protein
MLRSEFSVNFHFLFTFFTEFSLLRVEIQFDHFLKNDVIELQNEEIEIAIFFV